MQFISSSNGRADFKDNPAAGDLVKHEPLRGNLPQARASLRSELITSEHADAVERVLDPTVQAVIVPDPSFRSPERLRIAQYFTEAERDFRLGTVVETSAVSAAVRESLAGLDLGNDLKEWLANDLQSLADRVFELTQNPEARVILCCDRCVPRFHIDTSSSKTKDGVRLLKVYAGAQTQYIEKSDISSLPILLANARGERGAKMKDALNADAEIKMVPADRMVAIRMRAGKSSYDGWVHRSPPAAQRRLVATVSGALL